MELWFQHNLLFIKNILKGEVDFTKNIEYIRSNQDNKIRMGDQWY